MMNVANLRKKPSVMSKLSCQRKLASREELHAFFNILNNSSLSQVIRSNILDASFRWHDSGVFFLSKQY